MTSPATSVLMSLCGIRHPLTSLSYRKGQLIDQLSNNLGQCAAPWTFSRKSVQRLKTHLNLIVRALHCKGPLSNSESLKSIKRTPCRQRSRRNKKWLRLSPLWRERCGRWSKSSPCAARSSMHNPLTRKTQVRKKTRNMTLKETLRRATRLTKSPTHAKTREMMSWKSSPSNENLTKILSQSEAWCLRMKLSMMRLLLVNQMKKRKVKRTKKQMKKITRTLANLIIGDNKSSSRIMIDRSVLAGTSEGYGRMTATTSKKWASGMKRTLSKKRTPRRVKDRTTATSGVVPAESPTRRHRRLCTTEWNQIRLLRKKKSTTATWIRLRKTSIWNSSSSKNRRKVSVSQPTTPTWTRHAHPTGAAYASPLTHVTRPCSACRDVLPIATITFQNKISA